MTDETAVAEPAPSPHAPMSLGDRVRFVLRGIGQTLITLGLVVLLFVVYEVWITNIASRHENNALATKLEQRFARAGDDPLLQLPGGGTGTIPLGTGIANIYIPRLGSDYHWTIVEGTNADDLSAGPGHYVGTALPGGRGNFGVAGHRVGKGEPFLNIDKLRTGDAIVIETKSWWYVYRVLGSPAGADPQGQDAPVRVNGQNAVEVPGREIVDPSAGRVLLPVPNHPEVPAADALDRLLTLTTCHPKFTAAERMIIHATLAEKVRPVVADGKRLERQPAAISALYSEVTG